MVQTTLDPDLEHWLRTGGATGSPCERVIQTSISWIFLFKDRVFKLKRPVDFGFVDFTTLEKRCWAIERELAFNRVTAPDIYRAVHSIVRTEAGFVLDGPGEVVEWALEMRRFDETAVLSERPETVTGDFAEGLGRDIARFHAAAPISRRESPGVQGVLQSNTRNLRQLEGVLGPGVERLIVDATDACRAVAPLLDARRAEGLVRRCHGDLHLGNILLEQGGAVLFDCIEFSDDLSEIDVLYDLAFLLMDLDFRGRSEAANRALGGWLDEAARSLGTSVWTGLAALPLFQSVRAAVRAHVCAHSGDTEGGSRYLAAASAHLRPDAPALVAVGGLSGSGKTTFARKLAPLFGPRPGAVIVRSDEVRKRLWGRKPTQKLPAEAYTAEAGERVYREMLEIGRLCLAAGRATVLDAVFLRPHERRAVERLAAASGVPFLGLWLQAPPEVLAERVAARRNDASDADRSVLDRQLALDPGVISWRVSLSDDLEALARTTAARLQKRPPD
ncbi:MAG: AAA family ATPase [Caulobacteraceae bacterium]